MGKMKNVVSLFFVMVLALVPCSVNAKVKLNKTKLNMTVGESKTIRLLNNGKGT